MGEALVRLGPRMHTVTLGVLPVATSAGILGAGGMLAVLAVSALAAYGGRRRPAGL